VDTVASAADINEEIPSEEVLLAEGQLPQFATVVEMLVEMADFTGRDKCLEEVDGKPDHIYACFDFLMYDNKGDIPRRTRSTIIYVAMQAFAMTAVDQLKITCAPMGMSDGTNPYGKLKEFEKTVTVTRKRADHVIEKYLHSTDYSILMEKQAGWWTTTDAFDLLMLRKDSQVYSDLVK
jgi:hypothetical protein